MPVELRERRTSEMSSWIFLLSNDSTPKMMAHHEDMPVPRAPHTLPILAERVDRNFHAREQ